MAQHEQGQHRPKESEKKMCERKPYTRKDRRRERKFHSKEREHTPSDRARGNENKSEKEGGRSE